MIVNVKHLGKRKNSIEKIAFCLSKKPSTVGELIDETVKVCVHKYMEHHENKEILRAFTKNEIEDKAANGKVTFGIHYNETVPDLKEAIENARQSFQDGIVVIFINGVEMKSLDDSVDITDSTDVTFVRMTMLSGRMW